MDGCAPIFYYDLGSPECYLAAERVSFVLPVAPVWEPVAGTWGAKRAGLDDRGLPARVPALRLGRMADRGETERIARGRGLQAVRWPARWPPDSQLAMRAATYAKSIGRVTAFSLAAFRQVFAAGRDLDDLDTLVIAAAACEMHPAAVTRAVKLQSVHRALEQATQRAVTSGVQRLPALRVGALIFEGDTGLDEAVAAVAART